MNNFDIICISESYFNSDTLSSDGNLNAPFYNMSRAYFLLEMDVKEFVFIIRSHCLLIC